MQNILRSPQLLTAVVAFMLQSGCASDPSGAERRLEAEYVERADTALVFRDTKIRMDQRAVARFAEVRAQAVLERDRGSDILPPKLLTLAERAPPDAKSVADTAYLWLAVFVADDGRVTRIEPLNAQEVSPAMADLPAAIQTVRQWTYRAAQVGGQPIPWVFSLAVKMQSDRIVIVSP